MGSSSLTFFGSIAVSGVLLASPAPDPSVRCSVVEVHPGVASRTASTSTSTPTEVCFWITKFGFVGSVPYSPNAIFDWKIPPDVAAGIYGYRAQLFSGSLPVSDVTPPVWFQVETRRSRVARHGR